MQCDGECPGKRSPPRPVGPVDQAMRRVHARRAEKSVHDHRHRVRRAKGYVGAGENSRIAHGIMRCVSDHAVRPEPGVPGAAGKAACEKIVVVTVLDRWETAPRERNHRKSDA